MRKCNNSDWRDKLECCDERDKTHRSRLQLHARLRPCLLTPAVPTRYELPARPVQQSYRRRGRYWSPQALPDLLVHRRCWPYRPHRSCRPDRSYGPTGATGAGIGTIEQFVAGTPYSIGDLVYYSGALMT